MSASVRRVLPRAHLRGIRRIPHRAWTREGFEPMDRNERTVDVSPAVLRDLRRLITPFALRAYPEPEPLYRKLAAWLGVSRQMLLLTMGADAGLKACFEVFVEPGDEVVMAVPSYGMYPVYCQMSGAACRPVRFHTDGSLSLEDILDRMTDRTKLVVLANPNQPMERTYSDAEIGRLLRACAARRTLLVMDEAYHHFGAATALPWLARSNRLIVVRTFSKAFGMAGLRLGYVVSHPRNIAWLTTVRPMYETHALAVAMGQYLLEHREIMRGYVAQVRRSRAFLVQALRDLGLRASGRWGNWVLVALPPARPAGAVAEALKRRGYLVRVESEAPLRNHLRLTLGPPAQTRRLFEAFRSVLEEGR